MKTNGFGLMLVGALALFAATTPAYADITSIHGKVVITEGHITPACRQVEVQRADNGQYIWFRIAATGQEDGVLATTLTALTAGLNVDIYYDPSVTTGCGSEPEITWIVLRSPTAP